MNPFWSEIHWSTMIEVILHQWSWFRSPQRNASLICHPWYSEVIKWYTSQIKIEIISLALCQDSNTFSHPKPCKMVIILTKCAWYYFLISLVTIIFVSHTYFVRQRKERGRDVLFSSKCFKNSNIICLRSIHQKMQYSPFPMASVKCKMWQTLQSININWNLS